MYSNKKIILLKKVKQNHHFQIIIISLKDHNTCIQIPKLENKKYINHDRQKNNEVKNKKNRVY